MKRKGFSAIAAGAILAGGACHQGGDRMKTLPTVALALALPGLAGAQRSQDSPRLAQEQGIYNVGTMTLTPAPGGPPTTIQLWYPTKAPYNGETTYTVTF